MIHQNQKTQEMVVSDPQEALEITIAALSMMNSSINTSELSVKKNLKQFEKTRIFNLN